MALALGAMLAVVQFLVQRYFVPMVAKIREEEPPRRSVGGLWVDAGLFGFCTAVVYLVIHSVF